MMASALISAVVLSLLQLPSLAQNTSASACAPLHMIVARASTEPPGEGIIGAVAQAVQKVIAGSDSYAVVYPATLGNYGSSELDGVNNMLQDVETYVKSCPSSKIALLGYSQGAEVVGDVLCGRTDGALSKTAPIPAQYEPYIIAAIQMGDPSFVPGLPWDKGTATQEGIFPRANTSACDPYASKIQSYCDKNDLYCASGSSIAVHLSYLYYYQTNATNWIISKYKAAAASATASSVSSAHTSTGSASSMAASASTTASTASAQTSAAGASSSAASATTSTAPNQTSASGASSPTSTGGSSRTIAGGAATSWVLAGLLAFLM